MEDRELGLRREVRDDSRSGVAARNGPERPERKEGCLRQPRRLRAGSLRTAASRLDSGRSTIKHAVRWGDSSRFRIR